MCSLGQLEIDLRDLAEGETSLNIALGDKFFEALEDAEIKRGDVAVNLTIRRSGAYFDVRMHIDGRVFVPCDICLDDMQQPIEAECQLAARLGDTEGASEETICIDEADGVLDLSWSAYESIALAVPTRHVHEEGQCNPDMERLLQQYSASAQNADHKDDSAIDPRWSELEKLKTIIKD